MKETADYFNDTAVSLAAEGCHDEAIACLKRGLRIEPYNSLMWFNLGLSYYALKRKKECKRALYNALLYNPEDADMWDTLGVILHETGSFKASKDAYLKALSLEAGNGRIWNNYGTLLFSQNNHMAAKRAFLTALCLSPHLIDALKNLHDTYEILEESEDLAICKKLLHQLGYDYGDEA